LTGLLTAPRTLEYCLFALASSRARDRGARPRPRRPLGTRRRRAARDFSFLTEATLRGGMFDARVDTESVEIGQGPAGLGECSTNSAFVPYA